MPTLSRKAKPARPVAEQVYVCVESHWVGADGYPAFYREGDRVRGSSLRGFSPAYWLIDGASDDEVARARALLEGDGRSTSEPAPEPVQMVRATKTFTFTQNGVPGVAGAVGAALFVVSEGDTYPAGHPIPSRHPSAFEPVADDG